MSKASLSHTYGSLSDHPLGVVAATKCHCVVMFIYMVSDVVPNWTFYGCGLYALGELMRDGIIANFYVVNIMPKNSEWPLGELRC